MRLSHKLAEKNIWLSRQENCGLDTEKSITAKFPASANYSEEQKERSREGLKAGKLRGRTQ